MYSWFRMSYWTFKVEIYNQIMIDKREKEGEREMDMDMDMTAYEVKAFLVHCCFL